MRLGNNKPATSTELLVVMRVFTLASLLLAGSASARADDMASLGYLDVTSLGADPAGIKDSTASIQKAVEAAREGERVLFFPAGTYTISDTIQCIFETKAKACRLQGSTQAAGKRSVIRLAPNSPGFGDPKQPKVVMHLRRADEDNPGHFEQSIMSIDVVVGEGNLGAVGVRLQGAENTHIEDMTIDLSRSGCVGLWGPAGSGGSTHKIHVIGGQIGLNTYDARAIPGVEHKYPQNTQPTTVLSGVILENQTGYSVMCDTRGPLVMVGCRILRSQGPAMVMRGKYAGDLLSGQINLIDSSIEYASSSEANTVVAMEKGGRSFLMEDCYVKNAKQLYTPDTPANPSGWIHVRRLGFSQKAPKNSLSETPFVNGVPVTGNVYYDKGTAEAPPTDLYSRHTWGDTFPSFETPGAVNVMAAYGAKGDGKTDDTKALQAAIDAAEVVFLPKGVYVIADTLPLKKNTKLIGVYSTLSRIVTQDTAEDRFANAATSEHGIPMIELPDVPDGDVVIKSVNISSSWPVVAHDPTEIESYAVNWRCKTLFRDCDVFPVKTAAYHPAKVIDDHYKDKQYPDNGKYPSQMKYDVLPRKWPLIQARGNAEGRYYNFYLHGDHYEEPDCRLVKIEGTTRPISIYHFHCQHNQADYFLEADDAKYVAIYGSKSEMTFAIAKFKDCDYVRYFGHGGIGSPAPDNPRGINWFFRFENVPNFVFGGFSPQLLPSAGGRWISHQAPYHNWWSGAQGDNHPLVEVVEGRESKVDKLASPILYVRGDPSWNAGLAGKGK